MQAKNKIINSQLKGLIVLPVILIFYLVILNILYRFHNFIYYSILLTVVITYDIFFLKYYRRIKYQTLIKATFMGIISCFYLISILVGLYYHFHLTPRYYGFNTWAFLILACVLTIIIAILMVNLLNLEKQNKLYRDKLNEYQVIKQNRAFDMKNFDAMNKALRQAKKSTLGKNLLFEMLSFGVCVLLFLCSLRLFPDHSFYIKLFACSLAILGLYFLTIMVDFFIKGLQFFIIIKKLEIELEGPILIVV